MFCQQNLAQSKRKQGKKDESKKKRDSQEVNNTSINKCRFTNDVIEGKTVNQSNQKLNCLHLANVRWSNCLFCVKLFIRKIFALKVQS